MPAETTSDKTAAYFDIDGTIIDATVVHYYAFYATAGFSRFRTALWTAAFLPRVVYYLVLDKISRSKFNRVFYRNYRGMAASTLRERSDRHFEEVILPRHFEDAFKRITEHRDRGERVILITGSLDFIMRPLADAVHADELIAVSMTEDRGFLTGDLATKPIGDEEKARVMRQHAEENNIDLAASYGYADSSSDLPMLESVGHATVVNPSGKLKQIARERGWKTVNWS